MEDRPTNEMIERLEARLSDRGRELMEEMLACYPDDAAAGTMIERMKAELPLPERQAIFRLMRLYGEAHNASAREHMEAVQQLELMQGVHYRAAELEGLDCPGSMTFQDAAAILERHGESLPAGLDLSKLNVG